MNALWWLVLGLLLGWLVELAIDYFYWRKQARQVAERQALREAELNQRAGALDQRTDEFDAREAELRARQTQQNARDAELLAQARQLDERSDEYTRLEQQLDKRRADIDRMGLALNERERDMAARHEALKAQELDAAERMKQLSGNEQDVSRRTAVVSNREAAMSSWETRILAREREVADREAVLARDIAESESLKTGYARLSGLVGRQYFKADGSDDLEAIEGVGPKIAALLQAADIRSFERLSETPIGELTRILESAGPRFGLADPMTWAEQAALIQAGDYLAFEDLKSRLTGGVDRSGPVAPGSPQAGSADDPSGPQALAQIQTSAGVAGAPEDGGLPGDAGLPAASDEAAGAEPQGGAASGGLAGDATDGDGIVGSGVSVPDAEATSLARSDAAEQALGDPDLRPGELPVGARSDGPLFDALEERSAVPVGADVQSPEDSR